MRDKYVYERFPAWFIFGEFPDGRVDVSDGDHDVVVSVSREVADRLIADRLLLLKALIVAVDELEPEKQRAWLDSYPSRGW